MRLSYHSRSQYFVILSVHNETLNIFYFLFLEGFHKITFINACHVRHVINIELIQFLRISSYTEKPNLTHTHKKKI